MNPLMSMQVRLGMLETRVKQSDAKTPFPSAFKKEENLDLQNQRITEAVTALVLDSNSDPLVQKLAADWDSLKEKMKNATCGEIRHDLEIVIQDAKNIFIHRTESLTSSDVSSQSHSDDFEPTETQIAHEVEHQVQREEAKNEALEKHPRTFEVFMKSLQDIYQGRMGKAMQEALRSRDGAIFNMQTLLALVLFSSDSTVTDETFFSHKTDHETEMNTTELLKKDPLVLEKMLLKPESELTSEEIALKSKLNAIIAKSDMSYPIAQSMLEYGGNKLNQLDSQEIPSLPLTRAEIGEKEFSINTLEELELALERIVDLPQAQLKEEFRKLIDIYLNERNIPFVNAIFDRMNAVGLQNNVYSICLDLIPFSTTQELTSEVMEQINLAEILLEKIQDHTLRENVKISIIGWLLRSLPHPAMHQAIDQKIANILNTIPPERKREGVSLSVIYYAKNRNEIDRAASLIQTHFPEDRKEVLKMIQDWWTRGYNIEKWEKMGYPIPQWWTDLSGRF